ncbi:hypothetical protein [Variovorax guangxiensis]|uniref:hypothetical protein n=1 Tax=Variovorax guangxiensis TaxID=1775474 RepID=UPI002857A842|nr:hypothetical protein [Variovorax guangxiensis]MDR6854170.1 hypothetical protein [Variovorax guangxiensis]
MYYRTSDWSARWSTSTQNRGGQLAVMQRDGNFVVYDQFWNALWNSATQGRPGAYIAAQTDGNLVIYQNGQALWNIGVDVPDPVNMGDAVGRAMESSMPYAFLGHIGFFDQLGIYEVLNDGKANAVAYNTLANFKQRAYNGYWGAASPNIPNYLVTGCFADYCNQASYQTVHGRYGMMLHAFQILAIGADYTHLAQFDPATPRYPNQGVRRGTYRCDTYLLDIYNAFETNVTDAYGTPLNLMALPVSHPVRRWLDFTRELRITTRTPLNIFNKLKNYRG